MDVAQGTLVAGTSNASTTVVNSLSFQPKCIFFWTTPQTATGISASTDAAFGFGCSTGTTAAQNGFCCWFADHSPTTMDTAKYQRVDACIGLIQDTVPTVNGYGVVSALASNGFTVTWTDGMAGAYLVHYLAVGGSDITNVKLVTSTIPTAGATTDITGFGFNPDKVLFFGCRQATTNAGTAHAQLHIGATDGLASWVQAMYDPDNVGTSTSASTFSSSEVIRCFNDTTTVGIDAQCTFNSWITDGVRLNVTNNPATAAITVFAVGFDCDTIYVGHNTKPTSSTTKTAFGWNPDAVLFATVGVSVDDTTATTNTASGVGIGMTEIGAMTASAQGMVGGYTDDAAATAICAIRQSTSDCMFMGDPATTPTTMGTATRSALGDLSYTLSWASASAVALRFGYLSFGTSMPQPFSAGTLLDAFTRADGALGANYSQISNAVPTPTIAGNKMVGSGAGATWGSCGYIGQGWGSQQCVYVDIVATLTGTVALYTWLQNLNSGTYSMLDVSFNGSTGVISIKEDVLGVETPRFTGAAGNFSLQAGDTICHTVDSGKVITGWIRKAGASIFWPLGTFTTALTPPSIPSYVGVGTENLGGVDNLTGGINTSILTPRRRRAAYLLTTR